MIRMPVIFIGLVFWNVVLFAITIWLGVTHRSAHWQHQAMGVLTGIYTCLTHSIVLMHFMGSGKAIKEAVETHGLPNDPQTGYVRRTRRFKGRTSGLATLSCILIIAVVWLGGAKDVGMLKGMTHAWFAYFVVAFNLYSFWVEYSVIKENTEMIREIDGKIAGRARPPGAP
jgi:disulfide bond formation protein DsbB